MGTAQRRAGAADTARVTFRGATELAPSDPDLVATAALGYADPGGDLGIAYRADDPSTVRVLDAALAVQPPGDRPLTVRLQARLAAELYFGADAHRSRP